jgi:lipopolysaccharide transport system ATP-binding protein
MSKPIIAVENLGKKYVLSHLQTKGKKYETLRDVIANGASDLANKLFRRS